MKSYLQAISQSFQRSLRNEFPVLLIAATLLLTGHEASARGVAVARGPRGNTAVAVRGGGYRGGAVAVRGYGYGGVHVAAVGVRPILPRGYVAVVPAGYRMAWYGGYNCYYVGGVYYRPEFYQGSTVYVIVP